MHNGRHSVYLFTSVRLSRPPTGLDTVIESKGRGSERNSPTVPPLLTPSRGVSATFFRSRVRCGRRNGRRGRLRDVDLGGWTSLSSPKETSALFCLRGVWLLVSVPPTPRRWSSRGTSVRRGPERVERTHLASERYKTRVDRSPIRVKVFKTHASTLLWGCFGVLIGIRQKGVVLRGGVGCGGRRVDPWVSLGGPPRLLGRTTEGRVFLSGSRYPSFGVPGRESRTVGSHSLHPSLHCLPPHHTPQLYPIGLSLHEHPKTTDLGPPFTLVPPVSTFNRLSRAWGIFVPSPYRILGGCH